MRLEAENIGFRYGKSSWLFRNLNLTLEAGEVVGLTGPSGQGKTTLCRILSGLQQPLEGKVTINGLPIPKKQYHPVQLVFQHPEKAVNPRWKMEKVLKEGWEVEQELLDLLGIEDEWLSRWPNELSGRVTTVLCTTITWTEHKIFNC